MRKMSAKEIPNILEDGEPFQVFAWRGIKETDEFTKKESKVHMVLVRKMSVHKRLME